MSKQALGKGFEGLIPTGFAVTDVTGTNEQIKLLPLEKLVANPDQPRKSFDQRSLEELASSIKQHGIIQPLVATSSHNGSYRIVAGERRFRAAQIAALKEVPVIIRNHRELEELEIALVENVQRVDLSPLETAVSIVRLRDQFSLTPKDISKKLGKAETTVSNIIRLLQLPESAIKALQQNKISEGHARSILSLKNNPEIQEELLKEIMDKSLSVREAEAFVQRQKDANNSSYEQKKYSLSSLQSKKLNTLKNKGIHIKIKHRKQGGVVTFEYKNEAELDTFLNTLES